MKSRREDTIIAVIRDTARQFEESGYKSLLSRMTEWLRRTATPTPGPGGGPEAVPEPAPRIEYVSSHSLVVSFDKPWLADENDVDRYVDSMRTALLAEIRSGKRVQILDGHSPLKKFARPPGAP
jgi:hypothetical protein